MSTQKERFEEYRKGFLEGVRINKIDVKKAVKKLKEEIENPTYPYADVIQLIDKIFGEKLTK